MRKLIFCNSFKISRFVAEKMFLILHLISLVFRNLSYFFVACILPYHDFQYKIYIYEYEDKQITSYLTGNE